MQQISAISPGQRNVATPWEAKQLFTCNDKELHTISTVGPWKIKTDKKKKKDGF